MNNRKRYGLVIDLDRCTGCQTCAVACRVEHRLDDISGIRVETVGGGGRDTPSGQYPDLSMHYLPIPCMHCSEAPCIPACPVDAICCRSDGIVLIDGDKCDGCLLCLDACPYDALVSDARTGKVWKCNLCAHRVDEGLDPFCVNCCEMEAMFFGDLGDPLSGASRWASQRNAEVYRSALGTDPGVKYCAPRPPRSPID